MLKPVVVFFNLTHIVMVYLAKVLMIAMVLITFTNVVLRYGFNSGLVWSEEVSLLLAIWFIFIAMGLGVKQKLHISINLFPQSSLPVWLDKTFVKIKDIVMLIVGVVMLVDGWKLVGFTMKSIMPATRWPAGLLYLVLPISSIIIIYETLTDILGVDTHDEAVDRYLSGKGSLSEILGGPNA